MSLLNSASPFTSSTSGKKEKMVPRMMKTFETITKVSNDDPYIESFQSDKPNRVQNNATIDRDKRLLDAMNKMTSPSQQEPFQDSSESSDLQLGSYYSSANTNSNTTAPTRLPSQSSSVQHPPIHTSFKKELSVVQDKTKTNMKESFMSPAAASFSSGKQSGSSYSDSYRSEPYYARVASNKMPADASSYEQQLMEKLNYMIHLLEEQQKEPTEHILEEFILYTLLGIFMIYVVDSFTRVGKYTR